MYLKRFRVRTLMGLVALVAITICCGINTIRWYHLSIRYSAVASVLAREARGFRTNAARAYADGKAAAKRPLRGGVRPDLAVVHYAKVHAHWNELATFDHDLERAYRAAAARPWTGKPRDGTQPTFDSVRKFARSAIELQAGTTTLNLTGTGAEDDDLVLLHGWDRLERLTLSGTKVTDAGLIHLYGLTSLRILDLSETSVGDAGVAYWKGLTNLESLNLTFTRVTDQGLASLKQLHNLKRLELGHARTTKAGVTDLAATLPELMIGY